jgi:ubiquinone/menaquinone biosynthesis C-methylase UbiE
MNHSSAEKPIGAGKSSFELIDTSRFFEELNLKKGIILLDLACGRGAYSLAASKIIGKNGLIYAVDLWEKGIADLQKEILAQDVRNIKAIVGDAGKLIAVDNNSIDVCLMGTVLHDFVQSQNVDGVMNELCRALKPGGSLFIMEFKRIDGPPGPPIEIRLSPEAVDRLVAPYGFKKGRVVEVGPYNYLMSFSKISDH